MKKIIVGKDDFFGGILGIILKICSLFTMNGKPPIKSSAA